MKHCPICDERYDEEIIRFCTKDGAPLVDDEQPNFTELPSNAPDTPDDDIGEHTVIRSKPVNGADTAPFDAPDQPERIVIPTSFPAEQQVRPRAKTPYYPPPPPPSNTGKIIALTIIGTLAVLSFGAALFWLLQKEPQANININTNPPDQNLNLNANMGFDSNFNFDTNSNFNTDFDGIDNSNISVKSPTPAPTPRTTPQPSPSPVATEVSTPVPSPSPKPTANTRPSPEPTLRIGPRPPPPPPPAINRPAGDD